IKYQLDKSILLVNALSRFKQIRKQQNNHMKILLESTTLNS
ncbi:hypothetical protein ACO22_08166, partial [Paracoccidioides brasiliensis]